MYTYLFWILLLIFALFLIIVSTDKRYFAIVINKQIGSSDFNDVTYKIIVKDENGSLHTVEVSSAAYYKLNIGDKTLI